MITLPKEIQEAVRSSEDQPIRLTDPEANSEYILVPADLDDRIRDLFYEHSTSTKDERRALMLRAGLRAGWDDSDMDVYNDLGPRRR
ncbi:MAG: hypothetical protein WAV20_06200 [Blastocatellia bacterium]